jgi:tRNA-Thr(GGU) m(6)t(6)A37 methyltransferase TsaA
VVFSYSEVNVMAPSSEPHTEQHSIRVIARIRSDFPTKFGIPRQSGLVNSLRAQIVFEPEFRNPDAVRGLEDFSHIWLIWQFSGAVRDTWSPTVRPPRLGGNTRMGVFATRSPFRPNPIGLSSVQLERVELHPTLGPVLHVLGADLMDGTPIYDIKPYLPYADAHPEATGGFTGSVARRCLEVDFPPECAQQVPPQTLEALRGVLAGDPRPSYQNDPSRVYGLEFAGLEVRFSVDGTRLTVHSIAPSAQNPAKLSD